MAGTRTVALSWWSRRQCAWSDQGRHPLSAICGLTVSGTGRVDAMSGCPGTGSPTVRASAGSRTAGNVASVAGSSEAANGVGTEPILTASEKTGLSRPVFHFLADRTARIKSTLSADRCCADAWPGGLHRNRCAGRRGHCRNAARHGRCRNAGHRHHAGRRSGCPSADRRDAERHNRRSHHGNHRQAHHGRVHRGRADDPLHAPDHGSDSFPAPDGSAPGLR